MRKTSVCCASYLKNHTSWDFYLWYMCKMIILTGSFFIFWKFWFFFFFLVVRGLKVQKIVQNDKKFYLLCLISQEPYIIWFSFMAHMCKIIISPGFLWRVFQIFIFGVSSGVKGQNIAQNDKKLCLSYPISQKRYIMWLWFLVHICKLMTSPDVFFSFWKIDFPHSLECKTAKYGPKWQ